jgi:hypothetical protein
LRRCNGFGFGGAAFHWAALVVVFVSTIQSDLVANRFRGKIDPRFGTTSDSPHFIGRRVDCLGRSLNDESTNDPVKAIHRYLTERRTRSAAEWAEKAVVMIEPDELFGVRSLADCWTGGRPIAVIRFPWNQGNKGNCGNGSLSYECARHPHKHRLESLSV